MLPTLDWTPDKRDLSVFIRLKNLDELREKEKEIEKRIGQRSEVTKGRNRERKGNSKSSNQSREEVSED